MSGFASLFSFGSAAVPAQSQPQPALASTHPAASPPVAVVATAVVTPSSHPRYRAFASALSESLESFERVREWSDLISALQRVSKVLTNKRFTPAFSEGCTLALIPASVEINVAK